MSSVNTNYNAANVSVGTPDPVGNSGSRSVGGNSSGVTGAEAAAKALVHARNIGHLCRNYASIPVRSCFGFPPNSFAIILFELPSCVNFSIILRPFLEMCLHGIFIFCFVRKRHFHISSCLSQPFTACFAIHCCICTLQYNENAII